MPSCRYSWPTRADAAHEAVVAVELLVASLEVRLDGEVAIVSRRVGSLDVGGRQPVNLCREHGDHWPVGWRALVELLDERLCLERGAHRELVAAEPRLPIVLVPALLGDEVVGRPRAARAQAAAEGARRQVCAPQLETGLLCGGPLVGLCPSPPMIGSSMSRPISAHVAPSGSGSPSGLS